MTTKKKNEDALFDQRTVQFHIDRGHLKRNDFDKFLKALPDEEGNFDTVVIEEDPLPADAEASSAPSEE